jgi:PQQ-dependent dehydrogenase (methanol/ethanol family)
LYVRALLLTAVVALFSGFGSETQAADQSAAASGAGSSRGITRENASALQPGLEYEIRQGGGYSGQLAASGERLYLQTPFPHTLMGFEAKTSQPIWSTTLGGDMMVLGLDCCSATTGGPVLAGNRLYANALDGRTLALDAATGKVMWSVQATAPSSGESLSLAPLVVGEMLIVGNSGDDYGARGWIAALSAQDGHTLWKYYNTGSDRDVGIGSDFLPAYGSERGKDLGIASWPPDAWQRGGGLAGRPIYDPKLDLLIYATGHPAPWNPDLRPGDNKWASGIFARDPRTGKARWFTPINPGDPYAFGAAGSLIAAELPWGGKARSLLIHPDANGTVYVLDRASGAILAADPFLATNAAKGPDLDSGRLHRNDTKAIHTNTTTRDICPGWPGATGADGLAIGDAAYAPERGLLFIPANGLCMDMEARNATYIQGTAYMGANLRAKSVPERPRGAVIAWDVAKRRIAWNSEESFPVQSGVTFSNGIVYFGTLDGWFKALDAESGETLWQYRTASGIISRPLAFQGDDGTPYVAVVAGIGGPIGRVAQNGIDLRDATAAHGFANALRDLPNPRYRGGTLYVFELP